MNVIPRSRDEPEPSLPKHDQMCAACVTQDVCVCVCADARACICVESYQLESRCALVQT